MLLLKRLFTYSRFAVYLEIGLSLFICGFYFFLKALLQPGFLFLLDDRLHNFCLGTLQKLVVRKRLLFT